MSNDHGFIMNGGSYVAHIPHTPVPPPASCPPDPSYRCDDVHEMRKDIAVLQTNFTNLDKSLSKIEKMQLAMLAIGIPSILTIIGMLMRAHQ
jgi:hypothetical protein